MMRGRSATPTVALMGAALLLSGCVTGSTSPEPTASESPDSVASTIQSPSPSESIASTPEPATAAEIEAWIADEEWSFSAHGEMEPEVVSFESGAATDEYHRTYEIGVGIEGDANSDGIPDLVVPVTQVDGNGLQELWYVWLGTDDESGVLAEQLMYPIARSTNCGDTVHSVSAIDGGFRVDETLWLPTTDGGRDCASGGTGVQVRDIRVDLIGESHFPIQMEPVEAWGGVCPRSEWLDGILDDTVEAFAAPVADAPLVVQTGETVGIYDVGDMPLFADVEMTFFGFQPELVESGTGSEAAVTMHCAFAS